MPSHTPKQAAASSGFSLDTLRNYERIGLLPRIGRTATGRRVFSDMARIRAKIDIYRDGEPWSPSPSLNDVQPGTSRA